LRLIATTEPDGLDDGLVSLLKGLDPEVFAPRVTLYLHLTESEFTRDADGIARFQHGDQTGPITLTHARAVLGHAR
jgi:hypothetical protein